MVCLKYATFAFQRNFPGIRDDLWFLSFLLQEQLGVECRLFRKL